MTKRTRTQQDQAQWQAQRDERMSTLMQQLEVGVQAIQTSEDFQRYLRTAANFHQYSPNNVLLILAQKPDATRVAGYTTWQALGRQVKKGEKAIYIFAPQPYFVTTEDEQGEEQTREGNDHPDRDAQFAHINATSAAYLATGDPVISVDAKKKELMGDFKNGGWVWQPHGEPEQVNVHDFMDPQLGKAIPYGIYRCGAQDG